MEKEHRSFVNKIKILRILLEYGKPVEWRKKIIGFGLKGLDFGQIKEKNTIISRDIFNDYREELLSQRYITELKTADKRSHYYTITPYGISYLMKKYDIESGNVKRILDILLFFYDRHLVKSKFLKGIKIDDDFTKIILSIYDKSDFTYYLFRAFNCVEIDDVGVMFSAKIALTFGSTDIHFSTIYVVPNRIVWREFDPDHINFDDTNSSLNEKQFFSNLSLYVLIISFYELFLHQRVFTTKKINKSHKTQQVESNDTVKIMKKAVVSLIQQGKKQIKYDVDTFMDEVSVNINCILKSSNG